MFSMMAALVASWLSQSAIYGPQCLAPPPGASEACVKCYEDACLHYINAFWECDGNRLCREVALTVYTLRLATCPCETPTAISALEALNDSQRQDALLILRSRG